MSNIPIDDWLSRIEDEYLSTFIKGGGSSIKFAVVADDALPRLRDAVAGRCAALDYVFVALDAARLRAHMPQDIFFELARQMEWRRLARRVILRLAAARHYAVEGIDPGGNDNVFDAIAGANDLESQFLLREIRPAIQASVSQEPEDGQRFPRGHDPTVSAGREPLRRGVRRPAVAGLADRRQHAREPGPPVLDLHQHQPAPRPDTASSPRSTGSVRRGMPEL